MTKYIRMCVNAKKYYEITVQAHKCKNYIDIFESTKSYFK